MAVMPSYVAIDFETADYGADSACAVGMTRIEQGAVAGTFYSLIRPPRPNVLFTHIHGLTWAMLKSARRFSEIWPDMLAFMSGAEYVVAHNASFDRKVLRACLAASGIGDAPVPRFLCTLKGARAARLGIEHHRLDDVSAYYGVPLEHHHNALDDAKACALIARELLAGGLGLEKMLLK